LETVAGAFGSISATIRGSDGMPTMEQREYFARRAMEVHRMAEVASDPDIRATLEAMAVSYDNLVENADRIDGMQRRLNRT